MTHSRSNNHGFPLLQQGDEIDNWGDVVRTEAFIPLEERLIVADTSANRSNYTSYLDLLYYETDTGKWFEGDGEGSGWSETQLESRISSLENQETGVDAEDAGSVVVSGATALNFGTDLSVSDDGDGTATIDASGGVDDSGNVLGGSASDSDNVAVHSGATASGGGSATAVGNDASAEYYYSTAVGYNSVAGEWDASAFGYNATASGDGSTALGFFSEATAKESYAIGGGTASNSNEGVIGVSGGQGTGSWVVPGDFTVNGSKNFEIDHPTKPDTHNLRHGNYEGDVAGGLIYRRTVAITVADGDSEGTATITMPDWWGPLATDVDVVVQADGHFGDGYAERTEPNGKEITIHANESGDYKLIIFATRNDSNVPDPERHEVTRPKGVGWDGTPRAYYRDAPGVDPSQFDDVERVEQFFDHDASCDDTPCSAAFENWRVTFDDGERVDVDEPMDADGQTVVDSARDQRSEG